jgi:hypothetical protein
MHTMKSILHYVTFVLLFSFGSYSYAQNNTFYFGLGANAALTKLSFSSTKGTPMIYQAQPSFNQSFLAGLKTQGGLNTELEVARQTYRGEEMDWTEHRVEVEQLQARLSFGYSLQKKIGWTFLAGAYWARNMQTSNEFLILPPDFISSDLDDSDFGLHFKVAPLLGKAEQLKVSPYINGLVGLKNLEGEMDTQNGQITKLNAFGLGLNLIYILN